MVVLFEDVIDVDGVVFVPVMMIVDSVGVVVVMFVSDVLFSVSAVGRENVTPRPTANMSVINRSTQIMTMNTLVRLCFHHGSSGSRGVASYTVS